MKEAEYKKLVKNLIYHDELYYEKADPVISDYEYDLLLRQAAEFERLHPGKIDPNSPTNRIADPLDAGFQKKAHRTPMLSLSNTYSPEEIQEFIDRVEKLLSKKEILFHVELKMDGIAVSVRYVRGRLVCALTRGNGEWGDDITSNLKTLRSLPLSLKGEEIPEDFEARGEVYLPIQRFEELNQEREEKGLPQWANPRNAAAGSLKLLDSREVRARKLKVLFYGVGQFAGFKNQHEVCLSLQKMGLPVAEKGHTALCRNLQEILDFADTIQNKRAHLPFEIDGIVIKVDALEEHQSLGMTGKSPRGSVAYKFTPEQEKSVIRAIILQLGRTGIVTPVAELEPTLLSGSTITRATLHNQEEIARKDIRVGDTVLIEKGGDVIPKVVSVVKSARPPCATPWSMPDTCPFCNAPLFDSVGEVAVRCMNEACPQVSLQRLIFYVSKQGMDIPFLGEKVVQRLFEAELFRSFPDLYRLSKESLQRLPQFQEKSIANLLCSIEKAKQPPLYRFILALGIKYVGKQTARALAKTAERIEDFYTMQKEDFLAIEGVGEKVADSLLTFFSQESNRAEIAELASLGVVPLPPHGSNEQTGLFAKKSFVLTGSLEGYTREEAREVIESHGGTVKSSVSKKVDYLLAGKDPGSKWEKARKQGVTILSEEEFHQLLKQKGKS